MKVRTSTLSSDDGSLVLVFLADRLMDVARDRGLALRNGDRVGWELLYAVTREDTPCGRSTAVPLGGGQIDAEAPWKEKHNV